MASGATMPATPPNVIIIMTDDQGYGDLGCHGNPVAYTPNLDALHACSTRLTDFHVAPMCTPTRGQLLTSVDAARNGAVNVSSGRTLLRADLPTMADHFRNAGYRTGIFGKWHLGDNYPFRPQDRGFDETLWFPSSHISSLPDYWENDYFDDVYRRNGAQERMSGYCTEVFFREATSWMEQRIAAKEPFFTYLPTNAPHYPLFAPKADLEATEAFFAEHEHELKHLEPEQRANVIRFLAMIRNLDHEIGSLREFLERSGVAENTVIIFLTDNGSTFGPAYYNAGMRGGKITLYEGGHRVPCFIHWPAGGLDQGRDLDGLTQVQDLLPTIADWCGLDLGQSPINGISLNSAIREHAAVPDRSLFINYSRMPNFDYPTPLSQAIIRREGAAVLWRRWRLLEDNALYDLDTDPEQTNNVIEDHPEIAKRLRSDLNHWWEEVESVANLPQRIVIGSTHENPMTITGCEWWDVFLDQQMQVRLGTRRNSYWHLDVAQAGHYRFSLRRWPVETDHSLTAACPAGDSEDKHYRAGVALPIAGARLCVGPHDLHTTTAADDRAAVFEVELNVGPTLLHTWFCDAQRNPITGAYYVEVERLG
jgi:arylsulfatase A-like enzyme